MKKKSEKKNPPNSLSPILSCTYYADTIKEKGYLHTVMYSYGSIVGKWGFITGYCKICISSTLPSQIQAKWPDWQTDRQRLLISYFHLYGTKFLHKSKHCDLWPPFWTGVHIAHPWKHGLWIVGVKVHTFGTWTDQLHLWSMHIYQPEVIFR